MTDPRFVHPDENATDTEKEYFRHMAEAYHDVVNITLESEILDNADKIAILETVKQQVINNVLKNTEDDGFIPAVRGREDERDSNK